MLASSDPATFVALVLLLCVLLLILRQTAIGRQHRRYARRMAQATGHPSAGPAEVRPVRIMGTDGEYVAELRPYGVELRYETNAGVQFLGRYPSDDAAIEAIAEHEAAQTAS